MKIILQVYDDGLKIYATKGDLSDGFNSDCIKLCTIGRDDDSYQAVTELLDALEIDYKEVEI